VCLLDALSRLGRADGESAYLRLSTRRVDQGLAALPDDPQARARRRADVLAGAYRLRSADPEPQATIAVAGAVVPEAITAADRLAAIGIAVGLVVVSSYDRLWRRPGPQRAAPRGCRGRR
jgi:pyruvate dehydrogenase E1 component